MATPALLRARCVRSKGRCFEENVSDGNLVLLWRNDMEWWEFSAVVEK